MTKEHNLMEDIVEAPAIALEKTVEIADKIEHAVIDGKIVKSGNSYLKKLGPGLITGAADDDPSGIATYSQTGAQYGTGLLWMAAWTFPLVATIQEMCARIALVTGRGLAANIKSMYSKKVLYFCTILLFLANTLNIGANLGAMAKAIQLIMPSLNFTLLIIFIGLVGLLLQIFVSYQKYASYLKWLSLALLSYVATGLVIHMDWSVLLHDGLIPHLTFSNNEILLITGILGTTISPYLFFWETGQEVEEQIAEGKTTVISRKGTNDKEIRKMRIDVWSGMFFSNLVMFFIIAVCATTLYSNGVTNIDTAADAAQALAPLAGHWAFILFTLGIIGTGMLSIPVLAGSTSYAMSESFGWKEGLYRKLKEARAFYGVIIISTLLGILINFIGIDPIKALIYSAIFNGMVAPIIIFFIVGISGSQKLMGKYKNKKITNIIGWSIAVIMKIASIWAMITIFT